MPKLENNTRTIKTHINEPGLNRIEPKSSPQEAVLVVPLVHSSFGDTNGLFYYIGTEGGNVAWSNPITDGKVRIQTLTDFIAPYGTPSAMVDRGASAYPYFTDVSTSDGAVPYITFDLKGYAIDVSNYTIKGRPDSDTNNIRNWVLEGSNDNANWTTIDSRTSDTQVSINTWVDFDATSTEAYRYLRFTPTGVDSSGYLIFGFGEVEFYGTLYASLDPVLSHNDGLTWVSNGDTNGLFHFIATNRNNVSWANPITAKKITTYVNSQYANYGYYPYQSSDRGASSIPWHSSGSSGAYIIYDIGGYKIKPTDYTIMGRADYTDLFPRNWVLQGSNDLDSWDTLDTQALGSGPPGQGTWGHFSATATIEYKYLKILSTGNDSSGAPWLVIGEIEFYGDVSYG